MVLYHSPDEKTFIGPGEDFFQEFRSITPESGALDIIKCLLSGQPKMSFCDNFFMVRII